MTWKIWAAGIFLFCAVLLRRKIYATDETIKKMPVFPPPPTPVRCETPLPEPTPTPSPPPDPICTTIDYATLRYLETSVANVQEFLDAVPECDWCSACGSYSRYTYLEAGKKGLKIGELTLIDPDQKRVKAMMISGHRMNYFTANNTTYYIDNTKMQRMILRRDEIRDHIFETYGIAIETVWGIGYKLVVD